MIWIATAFLYATLQISEHRLYLIGQHGHMSKNIEIESHVFNIYWAQ